MTQNLREGTGVLMRTIVCEQPKQFKMIELAKPTRRKAEALVRVRRIGICGTDIHAYYGNQPYFAYPRILGHELSGVIEEVDANPHGFQKGDQVAVIPYMHCGTCIACRSGKTNCCTDLKVLGVHMDGGMCEWISVPLDHLIQTNALTLDESAILEPLSIGAHAVRRSQLQKDEVVLVIGAGPIGLGVMAFAKQRGAKVLVMDINEERLAFCQKWANVDGLVHAAGQPAVEIEKWTDGDMPTVVFDATGNARSMEAALQYVAHGGKLVFVGLVKDNVALSDPELHKRELTLLGSRNATRADFDVVLQAVREGVIDAQLYVTHHVNFADFVDEFEGLTKPESHVIKAVVEIE